MAPHYDIDFFRVDSIGNRYMAHYVSANQSSYWDTVENRKVQFYVLEDR